jgi:hypothetical protein
MSFAWLNREKWMYFHILACVAGLAAVWHHLHNYVLSINLFFGMVAFFLTYYMSLYALDMFVHAGLAGRDVNKKDKPLM